jgi:hypothetical protein
VGSSRQKSQETGFNVGWVSALDLEGRTIWIVDAHRDGKRFVVRANQTLTAFLNSNQRFALVAIRLDEQAEFLPNSEVR